MNKSTIWAVVIIIILIIGGVLIGKRPATPEVPTTTEPIKIGGVFILTGEGASWGEATRNGMELAIGEINNRGGIDGRKLQAIYEDDGSDPKKAIAAFNKLTEVDGVKFIIGPNWSNTGTALINLIKQKGV